MLKKTKLICTIGQQSANETTIEEMLLSGMNIARLNSLQGSIGTLSNIIDMVKKLSLIHNRTCAIMLDTNGPKIRSHSFKNVEEPFAKGCKVTIYTDKEVVGSSKEFSVTYPGLYNDVTIGDKILVNANNTIELKVLSKSEAKKTIECSVVKSGVATDSCLVTVPGVVSSIDTISNQDANLLDFAIKANVDFVAASFVRNADDVKEVKQFLIDNNSNIKVIAKIENKVAYENFEEILDAADGVIISRGDLSVEVSYELLPVIQKRMIKIANNVGKPIAVGTQVLSSMTRNKRPSRAEVADVANLVLDGVDAICLSNVTTIGKYPSKSVKEANKIIEVTEEHAIDLYNVNAVVKEYSYNNFEYPLDDAVASAVIATAKKVEAKLIISFSESGATSKRISKFRPTCPIVSISSDESTRLSLAFNWGIYSIVSGHKTYEIDFVETAKDVARYFNLKEGDTFIITGGNGIGNTNLMKVCTL